ncbi:hypothetical protein [Oryzifoliimicrobium ureilyticus]|uniref:hypothetical protein n=1 Tax=Oryzifoliimicrobium ureilyticus TaxID=3113724 RepID=UPI0030760196
MRRNWLISLVTLPLRIVIIAVSIIDLILRPLYRPFIRAVLSLRIFAQAERWIAGLPRLAILVLFALPFAIAEPMKVAAFVIMAKGYLKAGVVLLVIAHLVTFLVVERIYHAGKSKLLTYPWFAWVMGYVAKAEAYFQHAKEVVLGPAKAFFLWLRRLAE